MGCGSLTELQKLRVNGRGTQWQMCWWRGCRWEAVIGL